MTAPRPDDRVGVIDRLRWLRNNVWTWLLALVLLVVAISVGSVWTLGVYGGSSANPQNVVSTGQMSQTSTADNAAIMTANGLVPGESVVGTVAIANTGDATGQFTLRVERVEDDPGSRHGRLSNRLHLRVIDKRADHLVYSGPLKGLHVSLGKWRPGEAREYRFEVTFRSSPFGHDDAYQWSRATATFAWHAVQLH